MPKIIIVANEAREHIRKFHIPFIRMLKEKGWTVDLACRMDVPVPECDRSIDLPLSRNPFSGGLLKSVRILRREIGAECYDGLLCNTVSGSIAARLAAMPYRKKGLKLIYISHGLHFFKGAPLRRRFMGYFTEKALEGMTDVLVTVNSEDFETAQRCFKKPAIERLHGIGVDTERFCACRLSLHERSELRTELGVPPEAALLVYVAEINANKNQGMLLETLRCMKKKGRKANLLLVGPEHDGGTLRRNILAGGLEDSVVLCGWREDVPRLLQAADVYLASSLSEGLPINILEAMVSGLPVVAAENRGHSELIRHGKNGFLVKKNDHVSMAEYVMKLLDEPQTAARLSVQAQKDAESYSLEYVLREEYELIDKYIG